jgi:DnaJ-domain-containing protein 1
MTLPVWGVLLLVALGAAILVARRLPPRQAVAVLLFVAAGALAAARQLVLAVPLFGIALKLWHDGARATPRPGGRSEVKSAGLRMTLDHETGELDGEVTAGPFAGARLSALSAEELGRLYEEFEAAGDADSLALLHAWLDRSGREPPEPPPAADRPMTEAEAYRVLGLAPGASVEEVRAAYRRLMKRVHPDLGGSGALAAMLNEAKKVLDPG